MRSVLAGFIVFFIIHATSLRMIGTKKSVYRVFVTLVGSWMIGGGAALMIDGSADKTYTIVYSLLVACYILGVFAIVDSSIHVRILLLVAAAGRPGVRKEELLRYYNREVVVKKRLKRLADSGEITYRNNRYQLAKHRSLLMLRERLDAGIERLFP